MLQRQVIALSVLLGLTVGLTPSAQAFSLNPFKKKGDKQDEMPADMQQQSGKSDSRLSPASVAPTQEAPVAPQVQLRSPVADETNNMKVEEPITDSSLPPDKSFVAIDDPKNPLGISVSASKLNNAASLIQQRKFAEAEKVLNPLKEWLVEATEAHINLHKTLKNLPSAQVQAELEKQLALQFALMRDKAFFQLGMLGVGKKDYTQAVKNLSRVVQSQPRSPMGVQAYDVLQQIGFTEKLQIKEEKKSGS